MTHRTEHGTETLNYVYVSLIFFRLYFVQGHLWFKSIRTHAGRFAIAAIESVSDNTAVIRSLGAIDPVIILSFSVLAKSQCGSCVVLTSIPAQLRFASNYNALINLLPAPGIDYVQLSTHSKYTQHESLMTSRAWCGVLRNDRQDCRERKHTKHHPRFEPMISANSAIDSKTYDMPIDVPLIGTLPLGKAVS